tara:strand:- start:354 stop:1634 length:1281 start_codon:yes stop_codon:yes gene_type:complete
MYKNKIVISALASLLFMQGCVGIDSTAFYTKSNVGVEVSASPPSVAIDISRDEGVITPQFEGGKTLPVLASFKNENDGIFSGQVGSTFATGKAAVTMARLYDSAVDGIVYDSAVNLERAPQKTKTDTTNPLQTNEIRPVLFATKTSVGLQIGWSTITSVLPDSFTLGYNRKEMAILPVSYQDTGTEKRVDQASLLATLGFVYDAANANPNAEMIDGKTVSYLQYFATGDAASYLATKPEVRTAMIKRLDPGVNVSLSSGAIAILDYMVEQFEELSSTDTYVKAIWDKVKKKTYIMSTGLGSSGIKAYMVDTRSIIMEAGTASYAKKDFIDLYAYVGSIEDHISNASLNLEKLKRAHGDPAKPTIDFQDAAGTNIWSRHPSQADVSIFQVNLEKMQAEYVKHYQLLAKDEDVKTLFEYYISKVSTGG